MKQFPRQQKRLALMVLLPTPPRTYRRYKRGCSHGDYDSESDDFGNQGPVLPSTDEEGAELQRLRMKRRRSLSKGDDEEVFWLAGPKSDTISEGFGSGISTRKGLMLLIFRQPFRYGIASYETIAIRG